MAGDPFLINNALGTDLLKTDEIHQPSGLPEEYKLSPPFKTAADALSDALRTISPGGSKTDLPVLEYAPDSFNTDCIISNDSHTLKLNFKVPEAIESQMDAQNEALKLLTAALSETKDGGALLFEPVSPAGRFLLGNEFFRNFEKLAREKSLLLIADERRCGLGITGSVWGLDHFGLTPTAVLLGSERLGFHYLSKTDSCAESNFSITAGLDQLFQQLEEPQTLISIRERGDYLQEKLHWLEGEFPAYVTCPWNLGLFGGFHLPSATERLHVYQNCLKNNLIPEPAGARSLLVRPSFSVTTAELDQAFEFLNRAILDTLQ